MQDIERFTRLIRLASVALAVSLLVSGFGSAGSGIAKSRRSVAELVQGFSNATPIVITDNGQSTPSVITVSGFTTEVAAVEVTLTGLTHGQVGDVDALLIGPGGQTAILVSDVGSSANNVTLRLVDNAGSQISSAGPMTTGTFRPTNFQTPDAFSAPAPSSPQTGSLLGVFNSTNPNGNWTLVIRDDSNGTGGMLNGGWSLRITSANGVPNAAPDTFAVRAGQTLTAERGVLANDFDPDDDFLEAVLAGRPTKGTLALDPNGSFVYRANKKAKGTDSFTYLARDQEGLSDLETVTIQIAKAKTRKK